MGNRLTRQMREVARLLALGLSVREIALRVNRREEVILGWMRDPAVMQLFQERVLQSQVVQYARAVERIGQMLEDESPAVAQRAAHEALEQFEDAAMRMSGREMLVRVEGMPAIGMPGAESHESKE